VVERYAIPRVQPVIVMPAAPAATTTTSALVHPSPPAAPAVQPQQPAPAAPAPAGLISGGAPQRRAAVFTALRGPSLSYETQQTSAVTPAAAPHSSGVTSAGAGGVLSWAPTTAATGGAGAELFHGGATSAWQTTATVQVHASPAAMGMTTYSGGATVGAISTEYEVSNKLAYWLYSKVRHYERQSVWRDGGNFGRRNTNDFPKVEE